MHLILFCRFVWADTSERVGDLLTLDDKLQRLRGIDIFAAMPEEAMARVAAALTPLVAGAGATIFTKGEPGDSLYIVVAGQVRVHDGDLHFNFLDTGHVFGEMAVLDAEPRSASVTAVVETQLFRLARHDLYQIMAEQISVAQEIIHVLCAHLRARIEDRTRDFAYIRQVAQLTAAAQALEAGVYAPDILADVAQRNDALGYLARVFQHMAHEVLMREQRLKAQVLDLRIEIDRARQARQVADITSSGYFQALQEQAQTLRQELTADEDEAGGWAAR